jgi:hypothetical protein
MPAEPIGHRFDSPPTTPSDEPETTDMNPLMTIDLAATRRQDLTAEAERSRILLSIERRPSRLAAAVRRIVAIPALHVWRTRRVRPVEG